MVSSLTALGVHVKLKKPAPSKHQGQGAKRAK